MKLVLVFSVFILVFHSDFALGFSGRIIGGTEASILEHPYQASIHYEGMHICGGAILSKKFVLTAAHCLYGLQKAYMMVAAGSTLASRGLGETHKVWTFKIHEQYNDDTTDRDIALIKIFGFFNFGYTVQPIPIGSNMDIPPSGALATVSGWGYTSEPGSIVKTLRQAMIPIVDKTTCKQLYLNVGKISENMICAGKTGRDACQGDSGGPLIYHGKVIGIVSWGYGCARINYPGVYTHVPKFYNWVHLNMLIM